MAAEPAHLVELLTGDAEGRQSAYAELKSADPAVVSTPAVVDALVDGALCSAHVDAAEYRQVCDLTADLMLRKENSFMLEMIRGQRWMRAWRAPVLLDVASRQPAEMTRDDVLTVAADSSIMLATFCSWTHTNEAAGEDEVDAMIKLSNHPLYPDGMAANPDGNERLVQLALEVCRDPQGLPERQLAGVWTSVFALISSRPVLGAVAANEGIANAAVAELRKRSPVELVKWRSPSSIVAAGIFVALCHTVITNPPGVNLVKLLVDTGIVECAVDALKAFELHGPVAVGEVNIGLYSHMFAMLQPVNYCAPEAKPFVEQLQQIPSTLKFVLNHDLIHVRGAGLTTAGFCAPICAEIFGKQEDGFEFSQAHVEVLLAMKKDGFDGNSQPYFAKTPHYLKPIEALCISDANKLLMVKSTTLIPLLLSTLFLEADHVLSDLNTDIKAAIQTDATNCFLQIAVFAPGREMLAANGAAMGALHALADGEALSSEAKLSAAAAIMAIEGRSHEPQLNTVGHGTEDRHLMVSYQWDVQKLIERLVRSLQARGYLVWFDLDMMKGSTVDAMSFAIDNAEIFLYAVSEQYKESGNCRLEANYAHQQDLDMIPLLVEANYRPKGWLGLIMGTRLYYNFWAAESDDDVEFEKRLDAVCREIGDRGRPVAQAAVSEAIPPSERAPAPAPAPAPVLAPNVASSRTQAPTLPPSAADSALATPPRPEVSAATTADRSFTPTMQSSPMAVAAPPTHADAAALATMLKDQLFAPRDLISDVQVEAVVRRLEALRAAQLLSDDEFGCLEDCIADGIEATASCKVLTWELVQSSPAMSTLHKLIVLSEKMSQDSMFARQARRKFGSTSALVVDS